MSEIYVVVGGQFGSEAKGHVTAQLVNEFTRQEIGVTNIRVAGPNAGHTVYDSLGRKYAFRQLPVGAVLGDKVVSVIAAGSEVDPEVLLHEITQVVRSEHPLRLLVDGNATLITNEHKRAEGSQDLVGKVGSTGKGIGAARADRVWRHAKRVKDDPAFVEELEAWTRFDNVEVTVTNTEDYLDEVLNHKCMLVVEGTQGYGLGVHGEFYPQSTSSDCRAIDFLAMAGLSPWHPGVTGVQVVVVARVYPIRVAGNSGPLKDETTWEALGLPEERTTVTQKVRRVGLWDGELVRAAVKANGGGRHFKDRPVEVEGNNVWLALTMVDQVVPELAGTQLCEGECKGHPERTPEVLAKFNKLLQKAVEDSGAPLLLATTSPTTAVWF